MDFSKNLYYLMGFINRFFKFIKYNKKFVTFIIVFLCIFFGLKHFGYCAEWSDTQINTVLQQLNTIATYDAEQLGKLQQIYNDTGIITADVTDIMMTCGNIQSQIDSLISSTNNIEYDVDSILSQIGDISNRLNSINNLINLKFDALSIQLDNNNKLIIDELSHLREALLGSDSVETSSTYLGTVNLDVNGSRVNGLAKIYIPMIEKYTYDINITYNNPTSSTIYIYYVSSSYDLNSGDATGNSLKYLGGFGPGKSTKTITTSNTNEQYFYFIYAPYLFSVNSTGKVLGINESINNTGENINNTLTNDDISSGASDLPSDSTNDITADGFNNIFNMFYNAFTSSSSNDIVINVPFTNQSFVINYRNVFGNFAGGIVYTLASAFWYYVISVYIVKDIYKKIYAIKSGQIDNVENNNIKEDLL